MKAVIYDFDGTLCDSIPCSFQATQSVFKAFGIDPPPFETYVRAFGPPYAQYYWENGLPTSVSESEIWEAYLPRARLDQARLFPDAIRSVGLQKRAGYRLGLVTGRAAMKLRRAMNRHDCWHLFDCIVSETTPDKTRAFGCACAALGISPSDAYSVGDLASDMRDSAKSGLVPIGIVRHGHDVSDILFEAGASRVIQKLSELL
ncbi:MAG: HAD family hydrolase [Patescibacteria group bacterium]|nr:HAD family hydrolase [Patescibacteria group bacterium]